ncbi:MAG: hypothetical protein IJ794_13165 [Lachnospiraceae bacterium]|nr:hypothetical protein [Lachnospiraceae bacterium]
MKKKINISVDEETSQKLRELAEKSHKNMSQWITDKVWETDEKERRSKGGKNNG